ncbi:hypothetical protein FCOIX_10452 [Fusarium coicis]|nr:hypothetical protein FCOIX_10452 [Fusarium coicis]
MNRTKVRALLSSEHIIQCISDAYTYEGDALVVQMTPGRDFSGWDASTELDANHKGSYEFVVMDRWQYEWVRCDDVVVESPRRSKYLELNAAGLEKKLNLADEVKHFDALFKNYNDEKAKNGHTPRLVEIGGRLKSERDIIDETSIAIVRHNEELEAVEQYVLEE